MTRKPLSFSMDAPPPASAPAVAAPRPAASRPAAPLGDVEDRKQVGARIPAGLFRQLKAEAALSGKPLQEHVEIAIAEYLERRAKPPA
jgi:hypothetical protein